MAGKIFVIPCITHCATWAINHWAHTNPQFHIYFILHTNAQLTRIGSAIGNVLIRSCRMRYIGTVLWIAFSLAAWFRECGIILSNRLFRVQTVLSGHWLVYVGTQLGRTYLAKHGNEKSARVLFVWQYTNAKIQQLYKLTTWNRVVQKLNMKENLSAWVVNFLELIIFKFGQVSQIYCGSCKTAFFQRKLPFAKSHWQIKAPKAKCTEFLLSCPKNSRTFPGISRRPKVFSRTLS